MSDPTCTAEGRELLCRLAAWQCAQEKGAYALLVQYLLKRLGHPDDATEAASWPPNDSWDEFCNNLSYALESGLQMQSQYRHLHGLTHPELLGYVYHWLRKMKSGTLIPVADLDLVVRQVAYHEALGGQR